MADLVERLRSPSLHFVRDCTLAADEIARLTAELEAVKENNVRLAVIEAAARELVRVLDTDWPEPADDGPDGETIALGSLGRLRHALTQPGARQGERADG